jgi:GNAT superfamily N-acetyltransferase
VIDSEEQLDTPDLERLARLHVESIDDSLPALLGPRYAARLYRFLARSKDELLISERVEGRAESACVLSFAPQSLYGRIARATLPWLLGSAAVAVVARPAFRRWLRGFLADPARGGEEDPHAPEITYIFTNARLRGSGLGARLLARVDHQLRKRGEEHCFVKTLDEPGNRAISFYEDNGFEVIGTRVEGGRRFVEFRRTVARSAPLPPS